MIHPEFDSQNIPQNNLTSLVSFFTRPYNGGQNDWSQTKRDQLLVQGQLTAPKVNSGLHKKFSDDARDEVKQRLVSAELDKRQEIDPETGREYLSQMAKSLVRAELIAGNKLTIDWQQSNQGGSGRPMDQGFH